MDLQLIILTRSYKHDSNEFMILKFPLHNTAYISIVEKNKNKLNESVNKAPKNKREMEEHFSPSHCRKTLC